MSRFLPGVLGVCVQLPNQKLSASVGVVLLTFNSSSLTVLLAFFSVLVDHLPPHAWLTSSAGLLSTHPCAHDASGSQGYKCLPHTW